MGKIQTLSPIQINTSYDRPQVDAGMAGIMLLVEGTANNFQSYTSITQVIKDYQTSDVVYKQADAYFSNDNSPLFQVLTFNASDNDAFIGQLTKYYNAGAQYFLYHADLDAVNGDSAKALLTRLQLTSNFVEQQDNRELIIDLVTDDKNRAKELVSVMSISGNKSTYVISKNKPNGVDEFLGANFLSDFANAKLGKSATFVANLKNVTPQDKYEFGANEVATYFKPNNIATYAYRAGTPMMTSGVSQSGDQFQVMVVRDAITKRISAELNNLFLQNDGKIPYDKTGISLFQSTIYAILKDFADKEFIEPTFEVNAVKSEDVPDKQKASGQLTGMNWKYQPIFNVDKAVFSQTVVLPEVQG